MDFNALTPDLLKSDTAGFINIMAEDCTEHLGTTAVQVATNAAVIGFLKGAKPAEVLRVFRAAEKIMHDEEQAVRSGNASLEQELLMGDGIPSVSKRNAAVLLLDIIGHHITSSGICNEFKTYADNATGAIEIAQRFVNPNVNMHKRSPLLVKYVLEAAAAGDSKKNRVDMGLHAELTKVSARRTQAIDAIDPALASQSPGKFAQQLSDAMSIGFKSISDGNIAGVSALEIDENTRFNNFLTTLMNTGYASAMGELENHGTALVAKSMPSLNYTHVRDIMNGLVSAWDSEKENLRKVNGGAADSLLAIEIAMSAVQKAATQQLAALRIIIGSKPLKPLDFIETLDRLISLEPPPMPPTGEDRPLGA